MLLAQFIFILTFTISRYEDFRGFPKIFSKRFENCS